MAEKHHILYFQHTSHISGAAWSLFQLISALGQEHHECQVVLKTNGPLASELKMRNINVIINRHIHLISKAYPAFLPFWHWKCLLELFLIPLSIFSAWRTCSKLKPDIVHINTTGLFPLAVGAWLAGTGKIILHVREHWVRKPADIRDLLKNLIISRCVSRIIAITESNAKTFGFPEKTTVIHNWPDFYGRNGTVDLHSDYGIPKSNSVILFMGGRIPAKGALVLLNAMKLIKNRDVLLLFLGGTGGEKKGMTGLFRDSLTFLGIPTYGQRVKILADELDNVILAPATPSIKDIIIQSHIVVCPFIEPHFAKPAIEAGYLGKPVIISSSEEALETVLNGETGIIVPCNDPAALADAIDLLATRPELSARIGRKAQEYITANFNKIDSIRKITTVYLDE